MKPVLVAIVAALVAGGCVTESAMKVGSAHEKAYGYSELQLSGTTLQIRYKTMRWVSRPNPKVEDTPDRWISVSLDSLSWTPVDNLGWATPARRMPLECSMTRSTPEPAPAIALHEYAWPFKRWYSREAPDHDAPIAAYVDNTDRRVLALVRASSGDGQRFVSGLHAGLGSCYYDLPWAPYARAALVPFAVVADIITSPFQVIYIVIAVSAAGTGH